MPPLGQELIELKEDKNSETITESEYQKLKEK